MTAPEAATENHGKVVEKRIELQTDFLKRIIGLLEASTGWADWPAEELSVLVGAISADLSNEVEARKARDLKWHLFRGRPPAWNVARIDHLQDVEDRVRADLAGLVPLGIGRVIELKSADTLSSSV